MRSADLVRIARQRAGLTQAELAERSGISRETIARWEGGAREPSLASLRELVTAAGLDLSVGIAARDDSLRQLTCDQLRLSPEARLDALLPHEHARAAASALRWLATARSRAIVTGPLAAAVQGAPQRPGDGSAEVVAADMQLLIDELAAAGFEPLDSPERWATQDRRWPFKRSESTIVLADGLPGSGGYKDLRRSAIALTPTGAPTGATVQVAHPRDLLRLAEASSRSAERARIPGLRSLLAELPDTDR